ncbi:MAG: immunoglobulin domain-containing protein [Phycisphaerales bacterium]
MSIRSVRSRRLAAVLLALTAAACVTTSAAAQSSTQSIPGTQPAAPVLSPDGAWMLMAAQPPEVQNATPWIRPSNGQALVLKMATIRNALAAAPLEVDVAGGLNPIILQLPDPNGVLQHFAVAESPIMEPGLAAIFPDIKTYVGQGIDDPSATLRADVTPQGFHAQVLSPDGHWYIDPYNAGDNAHYTSYYKRDLKNTHAWHCLGVERDVIQAEPPTVYYSALTSGPTLRTYRLAVAATVEYTAFHGGTVALGQAAIVTAINRVTGVYEKELAVRLTLVANNSSLVYTTAPDPYTNGNGTTMLGQNQTNVDTVIGSANYDIGHVFSTGGGGIAGLGVVCTGSKARGVTGSGSPNGDPFWIDYVAHEMGHQFGGDHAFDGVTDNCNATNRNDATAYEPGSGSTIMNYAGICGVDNLQTNSDAYFNWISLQEIRNYVTSGSGAGCGTNSSTGNGAPSVSPVGVSGVTIPKGTPFTLTATGSDPNSDPLTYCWEEHNLGTGSSGVALSAADNGSMPLTRSFNPTTSPSRTVPQLAKILAGTSNNSEKLPNLARANYAWTVTARDNRAAGGGVERADVSFTVTAAAGPFTVTAPASATSWAAGSTQTVTWNVAGTTANGVNTATVNVLLSTDGGQNFPITLASAVPNNGSATFVVPNNQTTSGRIKVAPTNNIYFNIAPGTVTITPPINSPILSGAGVNSISDSTGNGNSNGRIDPGETAIGVSVVVGNTGNQTATSVVGTLSSLTGTVSVTTAGAAYPSIAAGSSAVNNSPYVINVSPSHPCGAPIALRLSISSAQVSGIYDFSLTTGQPGGPATQTFSYTGPVVAIPDNTGVPATAAISVSGVAGGITDLNFRFDGATCTNTQGATTVGLDHSWVGDLVVTLTSPQGTSVILANRPGASAGSGSNGNNFCGTVFDDSAASAIQSITNDGAGAPYTGSFIPANLLSAFNGQNANGAWTLTVSDNAGQDTGNIRAFSIIVTAPNATCDPPSAGCTSPAITTNPTSQAVCTGGSVTFNAAASGSPAPTYQWRKNTVNIGGATNASLTINPVIAGSAGTYDCVATNACNSAITSGAVLTVNSAPSIGTQPTAQTACVGSPASFTVAASGTPSPTFQWRKNTVNIGGATGTTLNIASVSAGDATSYDCVVTNTCGSVPSNAVSLTVNAAPFFGTQPTAQTACVGSSASFTVAASGTPIPTLQWRKNTVNIGGATSPTFTIPSVVAGDAASYDCVATNSCSTATSTAVTLTVQTAPAITTAPTAQTACVGSPASFTAGFSGSPAPTLQWRHDTVDIGGATGPTLSIASVVAGDVGNYDCVATNACGSITTVAVALTVQTSPSIDTQPTDLTVCEGSPASLTVVASGSPAPTYQWRRNTINIGGAIDPKLAIAAATPADGASYDCIVTNTCGSVTSSAVTLTVQPGTAISQQPTSVATCTGGSATFTVVASGSTPPTYQWRKDSVDIPGATSSSLVIAPVGAGDVASYDCIVTADCGVVTSSPALLTINCPNAADVAGFGNTLGCDGQITVDDLVLFLAHFFGNDVAVADIVGPGGGPPEGAVTVDDLTRFLSLFFSGCP